MEQIYFDYTHGFCKLGIVTERFTMKERVSIFVLIAAVLLWFGITAHSTDTNSEFIVTDDPVLVPEAPE